ncbi:MAG: glycerol-3-phosphate dehydrogenase [Puniceicoccaceae bacterium 5H]|nr:MAG: glycerol-3-phosphate dehydrogenase [Puniceicoccaceae bacterium 5H]
MNRNKMLDQARNQGDPFDIIVVGGGATGLGCAVDAASRGYRTLLVEQCDFAKGTSSRSTKLVHGGVRYLKQGNISLVLEALKERGRLYRNAPHLVQNMAFVIPNYKWWEGPFYGIGMKVYDRLAGKLGLSPSKVLSKEETVSQVPNIETEHLVGGVSYHDGQFDDTRLSVNLAQTAVGLGACVLNYVKCQGLIKEDNAVKGVELRDAISGEEFTVKGNCVINATGVFVDELRKADDKAVQEIVAVSQGIHIVLPRDFLPGDTALMVPKTADGRVLFGVPWHDRVVFGTTDTPLKEKSLEPRALQEERDFVLEHAAKYLVKDPTEDDVLSVFAGLRPLVKSGDSNNTAALSRDHTIIVSESGLITVTGGKWTTYRKMAQDVIDQAEMVADVEIKSCQTESLQIHGWTQSEIKEPNLALYGSDAKGIRDLIADNASLGEPLHPGLPYQKAEVVWHVREEMAQSVEDVLARRTRAVLLDARASIEIAGEVGAIMAPLLGQDEAWAKSSAESFRELARGYNFKDPSSIMEHTAQ